MTKIVFFAGYFLLLSFFIIRSDPFLLTSQSFNKLASKWIVWRTISFGNNMSTDISNENIHFYRQNLSRNAIFKMESLNFDLRHLWISDQVNVGIHGASKSSVIGDEDGIFVGSDSGYFYAFSNSGKLLWKLLVPDAERGIHSSAAIDSNSVYIGTYSGVLYRLDKKSGQVIWMHRVGNALGASPFLDRDYIVGAVETNAPDGYLVKIKKQNGELVWKSQNFGEQAHSSPAYDPQSSIVLLGVNNKTLQAFDYQSGNLVWKFDSKGEIKSTPLIRNGVVYFTDWGARVTALEIKTGKKIWRKRIKVKSQVSPIFFEKAQLLVAADRDGTIYAFKALDGEKAWKLKTDFDGQMSSPILIADHHDEKMLYVCSTKSLCLISSNGKIEKKWQISGLFTGSPFIIQDKLFLSYNEGGVEAFHIETKH